MKPSPPTPGLPGLDWSVGKGHRYARVPLPALDAIPRGAIRDVFNVLMVHHRPGRPIRLTNASIATQARCELGTARRALAWLKSHPIPDDEEGRCFILVGGEGEGRVIWILCRPLENGESDQSNKSDRARAGAQGGRAPARAPLDASPCTASPSAVPSFLNSKELNNVNVIALPEKPPACAREGSVAGPIGGTDTRDSQSSAAPVPPPPEVSGDPMDRFHRDLAAMPSLTEDQLRAKIGEMEPMTRHIFPAFRRMAKLVLISARGELEGRQTPALTPKVESLDPKPGVAPAGPPAAPAPHSMRTVIDHLGRTAGPGPVEDFVSLMAEGLRDDHSDGYFRALAARIRRKEVDPKRVLKGFEKYRNATVKSRGAAFVAFMERRE